MSNGDGDGDEEVGNGEESEPIGGGGGADPRIHLSRNRDLYGNVRLLWRNFVTDGTVTAPSRPGFAASNLLFPASSLRWSSPDVSDQAFIRIDLGELPWPSTTFVLHDVILSTQALWRLRGDDDEIPADQVVLPVAELGRAAGVQGAFADVAHGIDAATPGSILLPPGNAYAIMFGAPAESPWLEDASGLLRLRLRPAIGASEVTLRFELKQAGGAFLRGQWRSS